MQDDNAIIRNGYSSHNKLVARLYRSLIVGNKYTSKNYRKCNLQIKIYINLFLVFKI